MHMQRLYALSAAGTKRGWSDAGELRIRMLEVSRHRVLKILTGRERQSYRNEIKSSPRDDTVLPKLGIADASDLVP